MSKKQEDEEAKEKRISKKSDSITRLLKAAQTDIKSALDCISCYNVSDMDFNEGHTWANSAADKIGNALAVIKEMRS